MPGDADYENVVKMFRKRMDNEVSGNSEDEGMPDELETRAYSEFKTQYMPKHMTIYEKVCRFSEKTLPFKPDAKTEPILQEAINACHLETTPTGVYSASLLLPLAMVFTAVIIFFLFALYFSLNKYWSVS